MYNRFICIGNLTKEPDLRYTPQGTPVCTFRLAVNSSYKSGNERKEDTLFIDIVVFGKQGESCSKYLSKGKKALVEGRLQERRWEKDGMQKSKFEVVSQTVRFLSSRGDGGSSGGGEAEFPGPEGGTDIEPF